MLKKNKTVKLIEPKTEDELDTLNIDNYNIIFFHPNEMEFEELLKEYRYYNSLVFFDRNKEFACRKLLNFF